MHILLVHQNFPGQFKHLALALARRGHTVRECPAPNYGADQSVNFLLSETAIWSRCRSIT